jgi:hypothetical protein
VAALKYRLDAEALTAQERLSRLLHTPKPKAHIPTDGLVYDHFIVVGLPNSNLHGEPKILFSFPPDKPYVVDGSSSSLNQSIND